MVDRGADTSSFTQASYYFGNNIPGKPVKYLLNSGGRPKLFKEIARVVDTEYAAFRLASGVRRWRPGSGVSPRSRATAAAVR